MYSNSNTYIIRILRCKRNFPLQKRIGLKTKNSYSWNNVIQDNNPETAFDSFFNTINSCFDLAFPEKVVNQSKNKRSVNFIVIFEPNDVGNIWFFNLFRKQFFFIFS